MLFYLNSCVCLCVCSVSFTMQGDVDGKYCIVADDAMSMKYISRIRQKLKNSSGGSSKDERQQSSATKKHKHHENSEA